MRRIQQCILAIIVLPLGLSVSMPVTAAQPALQDFATIDAYIEQQMRALRIPGLALGIVQGDEIAHVKGFGVAGPGGQPVTPQTPFQINSLGKPMTALAVMQLVEADKLALDAPVRRYLPWFRVADETASAQITTRHLLYHTSGLPTAAGMEQALSADARPDALEQRVRALRSVQLNRPVGTSYEYSNEGYITLGLLVQELSGQSYETYMRTHLYGPLAMRQTFTDWSEARSHSADVQTGLGVCPGDLKHIAQSGQAGMGEEYKEHVMHNQIASQGSAPRRVPLYILLVAQLLAGFALGAGLAYLGFILGGLAVAADPAGFRDIVAMIGGVLIGYPLGVAGGTWLVGRLFGARGRLWATLLGAYLGVGAVLIALLIGLGKPVYRL
jgi:CubicO group peptidase (beta-lactamase class C family)